MPAVYIMLQENPCTLLQFKDIVKEPWNFEVSKYPQVSTDASVHVTTTTKRLYKCGQCAKEKNGVQKEHNSQTTVWRSTYQWRQEIWENACW